MNTIVPLLLFSILSGTPSSPSVAYDSSPPGEFVDMGGYKLHLIANHHSDDQAPTFVFLHGAGDIALVWNLVLPHVNEFGNTVAIDQNGEGWSEHGHGQALNQKAFDTRKALDVAGFAPPFIVVGHSLGGISARLFAKAFPEETQALVLVDATHPDVVLKVLDKATKTMHWRPMREKAKYDIPNIKTEPLPQPKEIQTAPFKMNFGDKYEKFSTIDQQRFTWYYQHRPYTYVKGQSRTYEAEFFKDMYENPSRYHHGNLEVVVLSGGNKAPQEGDDNWSSERLQQHSKALQKDLLNISKNSRQIIAHKSGHHIHIDEPELVVQVLRELADQ